jgi:orotidine-5'-phosphate decarboxylase
VGRPIIGASDPREAAQRIAESLADDNKAEGKRQKAESQ